MDIINIAQSHTLGMNRYWKGVLPEPSLRTVGDMAGVLAAPVGERDPTTPLYSMYRDLAMSADDRDWLSRQHIRYDITVIPPVVLGGGICQDQGGITTPPTPPLPASATPPNSTRCSRERHIFFSSKRASLMWWQSLQLPGGNL